MLDLTSLFSIHNAKSVGFERHKQGTVPFVSNGFFNNGVVGFVEPLPYDTVFQHRAICISAFCEATVQEPPFLPRGNGGSKLTVLEPRESMPYEEMAFYAAYINESVSWRFSYYRMVTRARIERLKLPKYDGTVRPTKTIAELIPRKPVDNELSKKPIRFSPFSLSILFDVVKGEGKYLTDLSTGNTPLISATNWDNGVLAFVDLTPTFKAPAITVERVSGCAFVQLQDFATVPDDMSVLVPKSEATPLSLFFLAAATLTAERWRFSYSRKLTGKRLDRIIMKVPTDENGNIDYKACEQFLDQCTGWHEINKGSTPAKLPEQ